MPDESRSTCSDIEIWALFTGPGFLYLPGEESVSARVGTLATIAAKDNCPLCRVVKPTINDSSRNEATLRQPTPREKGIKKGGKCVLLRFGVDAH